MDDVLRRGVPTFAFEVIGVGASAVISDTVGYLLMGIGALLAVYYYGGGVLGVVKAPVFGRRRASRTTKYGIDIWAQLPPGYPDLKPFIHQSNGRLTHVWADLMLEVRNTTGEAAIISELYLEVCTTSFPPKVVTIAEPTRIDRDLEWYSRPRRRKVEWPLPPHSEGMMHEVRLEKAWTKDEIAPEDATTNYAMYLVAELGIPKRRVRLGLEDDVMKPKI